MAKPTTEFPIYEAMDFAMVRTPLLPVEMFLALRSTSNQLSLLEDPRVRRAVGAGSVSLLHALSRRDHSALSLRDEERLMAKLLRYQIRMSTRPTPYGLFAGCAVVPFGTATDVRVLDSFGHSRTRPDMSWLMNFVAEAEGNPDIRRGLRFTANPLVRTDGGRISLAARMSGRKEEKAQPVSVRATPVVERTLELAKQGIGYDSLSAQLLEASPMATPEKVERLLNELREQTILLSDLRPPLTTESPAQYVLERLRSIPEASDSRRRLEAFLRAASQWDQSPHSESIQQFQTLLQAIGCPEDGSRELPCQVDMALSATGQIGPLIAQEAARAAEILLRLSPFPGGLASIAAYRGAFVNRYGHEREVPLMELLDPARGLGPVSAHGHAFTGPTQAKGAKRARTLLALACSALHRRQRVLSLDESTLRDLETSQLSRENAPVSLDINLMVAAGSAAAIDRGEFSVAVGPNLGAWAACRNFGRFAHLFSAENGLEPLRRAAALEEVNLPDHIWAEVVYLPSNVRSANVAVRPSVRSHEICFGVAPGVPAERVILPEDLVVGVAGGRFYIHSLKEGKKVRFISGHMLNNHGAPAIAQFLLDVSHDGTITFNSFDWGQAEAFPCLPRVEVGRIVLRPAEWRITKDKPDAEGLDALGRWRAEWNVPQYVCLTFGDNRLVLDLDCPAHLKQVQAELAKLPEGESLLLQEVFPALDDVWLTGPEGHYYSELIVPLVRSVAPNHPVNRSRADESSEPRQPSLPATSPKPVVPDFSPGITKSLRLRPPGSEWLFAKLYCPARCEDELIADRILPMAENAIAAGLAEAWFYIRYADPEGHIRLRFRGDAGRLSGHLFGHLGQWAQGMIEEGLCTRVVFDTYDREIERFGGLEGMAVAENIFHADSRAAAALVKVLRAKHWENPDCRSALYSLCVDDLTGVAGFSDSERLSWYRNQSPENDRASGAEYRKLKNLLRKAIGNRAEWLRDTPQGQNVSAALVRRAEDLAGPSARLVELASEGILSQSVERLCASYIHLHLNRIGAATAEKTVLSLIFRTRDSLTKSPLKPDG